MKEEKSDKATKNHKTSKVIDDLQEGTELGSIKLHHNVLAVIARVAALKVPGVIGMSGSLTDNIATILGSKTVLEKGVKVEELPNNLLRIELNLIIEFGVNIPKLAWRVQNEVSQAIKEMTGRSVSSIDVIIQGVEVRKEKENSDMENII